MSRGCFFVESVWGVGHFVRLFEIAKQCGEVDLFYAGPKTDVSAPHVTLHELPSFFSFHSFDTQRLLPNREEILEQRLLLFREKARGSYDYYVIEAYPFTKSHLKLEFSHHIAHLRAQNPKLRIYSSYRGYNQVEEDVLGADIHRALLHYDPQFFPERSLPFPVSCTGFVAPSIPYEARREKSILISAGSGYQARALLPLLPHLRKVEGYEIKFFAGPHTPENLLDEFPEIEVKSFSQNFREELAKASLSISLAGYNTLMDLLQTKTPALVVCGASDQKLFPKVLEERALVVALDSKEMDAQRCAEKLSEALSFTPSTCSIDFSGAQTSTKILMSGF